jgi:hypothetical protein
MFQIQLLDLKENKWRVYIENFTCKISYNKKLWAEMYYWSKFSTLSNFEVVVQLFCKFTWCVCALFAFYKITPNLNPFL